jgi:rhodanese-related sulfurtransferase
MRRFFYLFGFLLLAPLATVWAADGATKVDISEAKALHDKGVLFVDVRRESSFRYKHIPSAQNLAVFGKKFDEPNLSALVAKDKPVVFYCNCKSDQCNLSPLAANDAVKMGFKKVYYLKAAIDGWSKAGYAVQKAK